jgi:N-acetylmuramoyl-L-alanine amidase
MGSCRARLFSILMAALLLGAAGATEPAELTFHTDSRGTYASYRLKDDENVWRHVVRRFTSRTDAVGDTESVERVLERSGLSDERRIPNNAEIKIPVELLADEYRPAQITPASSPLAGVVVILDAGHGGVDTGARGRNGVYEDEVVYDIMCRAKRFLENETAATVFVTIRDKSRGFGVSAMRRDFPCDRDEYILTTPAYQNLDATVGLHLRWYLANSLCRAALARGTASDRVIFTSFHADDLDANLRGAMIYVPGARLCEGMYGKSGRPYTRFAEVRERPTVSFTARERERSERLSRAFADELLQALRAAGIAVFRNKPIRDCIVRRRAFVPAVLRYNAVPTKVLVECGNLSNSRDCANLADPTFRERLARAYVEALIRFTATAH